MKKRASKIILSIITFLDGFLMWVNGYRKIEGKWIKSDYVGGNTYITRLQSGKPLTDSVRKSIIQ